jgi:hypothetical protein
MVLVLLCLVVVATFATPEASRVQSILRSSRAYKIANKEYRAKRVAAGLSPDVVPHTQYIRMRDGTVRESFSSFFFVTLWGFPAFVDSLLGSSHQFFGPASYALDSQSLLSSWKRKHGRFVCSGELDSLSLLLLSHSQ